MISTAVSPRFTNRVAIVSGAGSGSGRATAIRLARQGAHVIATDPSLERLHMLEAEFLELGFITIAGDVSTEQTAQAVMAAAGREIDLIISLAEGAPSITWFGSEPGQQS